MKIPDENGMRFIEPSPEYLNSYYELCAESYATAPHAYILHDPEKFDIWKNTIFDDYAAAREGRNLPEGFVPAATYWVVIGKRVIAVVNIRLRLTPALEYWGGTAGTIIRTSERGKNYAFELYMKIFDKVRELGAPQYYTCTDSNKASLRVLEKTPWRKKERIFINADGKDCWTWRFWL